MPLLCLVSPALTAAPLTVSIRVDGVVGEIRETIIQSLSLQRERGHPLLSEHRIERLHRRAPEEIRAALQPFGYYEPEISSSLTREGERWLARYTIAPGRPVRVTRVDLIIEGEGENDRVLQEWRQAFPLGRGDILLHDLYEGAKEDLLRIARDRGYLEGELRRHEIRVSTEEYRAEILLHYATGPRYRFGEIDFSEVPLDDDFLHRFAEFHRGDHYDADRLFALQRALSNSDYFERVEVVPRTDAPEEGRIPIETGLVMRKRDRYTAGLGYGTDTGPRLSLGVERRWVNRSGHRVGADILASEIRRGVTVNYRIPLKRPTTDFLGFTARREREATETAISDISAVSGNVSQLVEEWMQTVSLNYQEENFEVGESIDRSTMLFPALALQRVSADDRLFPTRGWRILADGRIAGEFFWSSTSLLQGRVNAKGVLPVAGGRLISRFDLAGSYVTDFESLPVSLRFFAGGDHSVRGFTYQSLGPTDGGGDVVGGRHLLVGSVEYDFYLGPRFGLAAFSDVGNAFNSFSDYELHQGAGLGMRWRLPFGIIRLDLASAVSEDGKPWRLHLSIGPDL